jgi:putative hydrolase of the HAD superfamily
LPSDAVATVQGLADRGYVLGLASNYDSRLRDVLAEMPALSAIRHVVISAEVGWRKPAAEFFAALCRTLGRAPEQILFVGDDRGNDYDGARSARLNAVLFDPRGKELGVERIARLGELLSGEHH